MLWAGHREAARGVRFSAEHIDACRQRYRSFFDATDGQLDGDWALEDTDCAYLLLNELLYAEETSKLARLPDRGLQAVRRQPQPDGRQVLLIVDEFSAIADGERMARMVEIVRSYGAAVVLAPQAYEGMGGPEAAARILNAAHTIILHAVPDPEPIIRAAGTQMAIEWSSSTSRPLDRARLDPHAAPVRVDPNEVRRLTPGMCFVIGAAAAQKLQISPRHSARPRALRPPGRTAREPATSPSPIGRPVRL